MSESNSDPRYTMGRSEGETERLIQQSQLYEAVTRRFFQVETPASLATTCDRVDTA